MNKTITIGVKATYNRKVTRFRAYIAGLLIRLAQKIVQTDIKVEFTELRDK